MDAQDLLNLIKTDGGSVYRDDDIIVTPKHVVFRTKWGNDNREGIYRMGDIRSTNAMQSINWAGVFSFGVFCAGAVYFGWVWAAVICAALGFLVWKFSRDGTLFLHLGSGDSIMIPSTYNRVITQKEAIESQRSGLQAH